MASDHRIIFGDALEVLRRLDAESVDCCVTSPPYFNLRDYHVPGQIGLEATIDEYVARLVEVFAEVRRVLKPGGTLALVLGDSYASGKGTCFNPGGGENSVLVEKRKQAGVYPLDRGNVSTLWRSGLKPKDLCMIPARVALELQADGWWIRSDIIWAKGLSGEATRGENAWVGSVMPESVTDRPTQAHDHIFLLAKAERYWYDHYAVQENGKYPAGTKAAKGGERRAAEEGVNARPTEYAEYSGKRNLRDVLTVSPRGFKGEHYAAFPVELPLILLPALCPPRICATCGKPWQHLVERISKGRSYATGKSKAKRDAGLATAFSGYDDGSPSPTARDLGYFPDCPHYGYGGDNLAHRVQVLLKAKGGENVAAELAECIALRDAIPEDSWLPGTVLDPFLGSGTTTQAARKLGRRSIGIELNGGYERVIRERLACPEGALIQDVEFEHEEART